MAQRPTSRTTITLWVLAAIEGVLGLLMFRADRRIAAVNALGAATLSWAGWHSGQTDLHRATQDRAYLEAEGVRNA